jgi:hypothetical protein
VIFFNQKLLLFFLTLKGYFLFIHLKTTSLAPRNSFKQVVKLPAAREPAVLKDHQMNIMENQENEIELVEEPNTYPKPHSNGLSAEQNSELHYQTIFLNLTTKLTDLSSKLNSLLTRVDGLESSLPPSSAVNGFSRTFESASNNSAQSASSDSTVEISRLSRLCEGLTARMTVLETDILLIKQVCYLII